MIGEGVTWWRVSGHYSPKIEPVQVLSHTEKTVTLVPQSRWDKGGRRHKITSSWDRFFRTWEEAHAHLLASATSGERNAREALKRAQDVLGNVKGMKPPC